MALGKDRARINVKGNVEIQVREISPTPTNSFSKLGFTQETNLNDSRPMVDAVDDTGRLIDTNVGSQKVVLRAFLMQTNIDEINLMNGADGKYYEVYMKAKLKNGKYQELNIPVARIQPGMSLDFKAGTLRRIEVVIYALAPKADMVRNPTVYNILEDGNPYVLIENAAAQGVPVDNASDVATALI